MTTPAIRRKAESFPLGNWVMPLTPSNLPHIGYQLQLLAGAWRRTMGADAPLQKPCALHCGSSAASCSWPTASSSAPSEFEYAQSTFAYSDPRMEILLLKKSGHGLLAR